MQLILRVISIVSIVLLFFSFENKAQSIENFEQCIENQECNNFDNCFTCDSTFAVINTALRIDASDFGAISLNTVPFSLINREEENVLSFSLSHSLAHLEEYTLDKNTLVHLYDDNNLLLGKINLNSFNIADSIITISQAQLIEAINEGYEGEVYLELQASLSKEIEQEIEVDFFSYDSLKNPLLVEGNDKILLLGKGIPINFPNPENNFVTDSDSTFLTHFDDNITIQSYNTNFGIELIGNDSETNLTYHIKGGVRTMTNLAENGLFVYTNDSTYHIPYFTPNDTLFLEGLGIEFTINDHHGFTTTNDSTFITFEIDSDTVLLNSTFTDGNDRKTGFEIYQTSQEREEANEYIINYNQATIVSSFENDVLSLSDENDVSLTEFSLRNDDALVLIGESSGIHIEGIPEEVLSKLRYVKTIKTENGLEKYSIYDRIINNDEGYDYYLFCDDVDGFEFGYIPTPQSISITIGSLEEVIPFSANDNFFLVQPNLSGAQYFLEQSLDSLGNVVSISLGHLYLDEVDLENLTIFDYDALLTGNLKEELNTFHFNPLEVVDEAITITIATDNESLLINDENAIAYQFYFQNTINLDLPKDQYIVTLNGEAITGLKDNNLIEVSNQSLDTSFIQVETLISLNSSPTKNYKIQGLQEDQSLHIGSNIILEHLEDETFKCVPILSLVDGDTIEIIGKNTMLYGIDTLIEDLYTSFLYQESGDHLFIPIESQYLNYLNDSLDNSLFTITPRENSFELYIENYWLDSLKKVFNYKVTNNEILIENYSRIDNIKYLSDSSSIFYYDKKPPEVITILDTIKREQEYINHTFQFSEYCQSSELEVIDDAGNVLFTKNQTANNTIEFELENLQGHRLENVAFLKFKFNLVDQAFNQNNVTQIVPIKDNNIIAIQLSTENVINDFVKINSVLNFQYQLIENETINEELSNITIYNALNSKSYYLSDSELIQYDVAENSVSFSFNEEVLNEFGDVDAKVNLLLISQNKDTKSYTENFFIDFTPPITNDNTLELIGLNSDIDEGFLWTQENVSPSLSVTINDVSLAPSNCVLIYNIDGVEHEKFISSSKKLASGFQLSYDFLYELLPLTAEITLSSIILNDVAGNTSNLDLTINPIIVNKNNIVFERSDIKYNNTDPQENLSLGECEIAIPYSGGPVANASIRFLNINELIEYSVVVSDTLLLFNFIIEEDNFNENIEFDFWAQLKSGKETLMENIQGPSIIFDIIPPEVLFNLSEINRDRELLDYTFEFSEICPVSSLKVSRIMIGGEEELIVSIENEERSQQIGVQLENLNSLLLENASKLKFEFTLIDDANFVINQMFYADIIDNEVSDVYFSLQNSKNAIISNDSRLILNYTLRKNSVINTDLSKVNIYNEYLNQKITIPPNSNLLLDLDDFFIEDYGNSSIYLSALVVTENGHQKKVETHYFIDVIDPISEYTSFINYGIDTVIIDNREEFWIRDGVSPRFSFYLEDVTLNPSNCYLEVSEDTTTLIELSSFQAVTSGYWLTFERDFELISGAGRLSLLNLILEDSAGNTTNVHLEDDFFPYNYNKNSLEISSEEITYFQDSSSQTELTLGECSIIVPYLNSELKNAEVIFSPIDIEKVVTIDSSNVIIDFFIESNNFDKNKALEYSIILESKSDVEYRFENIEGPLIHYDITPPTVNFDIDDLKKGNNYYDYTFSFSETCSYSSLEVFTNSNVKVFSQIIEDDNQEVTFEFQNLNNSRLEDVDSLIFNFTLRDLEGNNNNQSYTIPVFENDFEEVALSLINSLNGFIKTDTKIVLDYKLSNESIILDPTLSNIVLSNSNEEVQFEINDTTNIDWDKDRSVFNISIPVHLLEESNNKNLQISVLLISNNGDEITLKSTFRVDVTSPSFTTNTLEINGVTSTLHNLLPIYWGIHETNQKLQVVVEDESIMPSHCYLELENSLLDTLKIEVNSYTYSDGNMLLNFQVPYNVYQNIDLINVFSCTLQDSAGNSSITPVNVVPYQIDKKPVSIDVSEIEFYQNNRLVTRNENLALGTCIIKIPYTETSINHIDFTFNGSGEDYLVSFDSSAITIGIDINSSIFNSLDSIDFNLSVKSNTGIETIVSNIISPVIFYDIIVPTVNTDLKSLEKENEYINLSFPLSETCNYATLNVYANDTVLIANREDIGEIDTLFIALENLNSALLMELDSLKFSFDLKDVNGNENRPILNIPVVGNNLKTLNISLDNSINNIINKESRIIIDYEFLSKILEIDKTQSKVIIYNNEYERHYNLEDTTVIKFFNNNQKIEVEIPSDMFSDYEESSLNISTLIVTKEGEKKSKSASYKVDFNPPLYEAKLVNILNVDSIIINSDSSEFWANHEELQQLTLSIVDTTLVPNLSSITYHNSLFDTIVCDVKTYNIKDDTVFLNYELDYQSYQNIDFITLLSANFVDSAGNSSESILETTPYNVNKNSIDLSISEIEFIQNNISIPTSDILTFGSCKIKIPYSNSLIKSFDLRFLEIENQNVNYTITYDRSFIFIDFILDNQTFKDGNLLKFDLSVETRSGIVTLRENIIGPLINFSIPAEYLVEMKNVQVNQWPYINDQFQPLELQLDVKDSTDTFRSNQLQVKTILDESEIILYESSINLIDSTTFLLKLDHTTLTTPIGNDFKGELPLIITIKNDFGERNTNIGIIVISEIPNLSILNEWSLFSINAPPFQIKSNLDSNSLVKEILYASQNNASINVSNLWNIAEKSINNKNVKNISIPVEAIDFYGGSSRDSLALSIVDIPLFKDDLLAETYCHFDTSEVRLLMDSIYLSEEGASKLDLKLFRIDNDGIEIEVDTNAYNIELQHELTFIPSSIYLDSLRESKFLIKLFYNDTYEIANQSFKIINEETIQTSILAQNIYDDTNNDIIIKLEDFDSRIYSIEILNTEALEVINSVVENSQDFFLLRKVNDFEVSHIDLLLTAESERGVCGIAQVFEIPIIKTAEENFNEKELLIELDSGWVEQIENENLENIIRASNINTVWNSVEQKFSLVTSDKNGVVTLTSKSYDISNFDYPILEVEYSSNLSNRNGVFVQLQQNENEAWKTIGTTNEIVNWYNTLDLYNNDLASNNNGYSWSGVLSERTGKLFLLDYVDSTKSVENLRFRFVLAHGKIDEEETFNIYNFRIFEKQKNIIIESFFQADNSTHSEINESIDQVLNNLSRYDNEFNHYFYFERSQFCDNYLEGEEYIEARRAWYNLKSQDVQSKKFHLILNGHKIEGETSQELAINLRESFIKEVLNETDIDFTINYRSSEEINLSYNKKSLDTLSSNLVWVVLIGNRTTENNDCSDFRIPNKTYNQNFTKQYYFEFDSNRNTITIPLNELIVNQNNIFGATFLLQNDISKEIFYSKYIPIDFKDDVTNIEAMMIEKLQIIPNPVSDSFKVNTKVDLRTDEIKILNNLGKEVRFTIETFSPFVKINVEQLPMGVYHLYLNSNNEVHYIRFIKS